MKITKRAAATTSAFAGLALVLGGSTFAVASGYNPFPAEPAAVVETADFVATSTENGLAAEQEADAAAAVAAAAAQAEADRVAAEAAAAAEANRIAAEQAAAVEAENAAPDSSGPDAPSAPSVTYCPAGTTAGAVDDAGNEYNCAATGGATGTQMCVAYNDANECTAWLEG